MPIPNIIVIMTDQQKASASHLWGNTFCHTPSLARLASEGILYEHAYTPHPLCVPARVSLWTGQFPHTHGARRNETLMPEGALHAFRIWKDAGLRTGLIGKNHCFDRPEDLALFDVWCELSHGGLNPRSPQKGMDWVRPVAAVNAANRLRRELSMQNPQYGYAVSDHPEEDHSSALISAQTVAFLRETGTDPFALWVSFPDPHEPWVAPRRYAEMFPPEVVELPPFRESEFEDDRTPERSKVLYRMLGMDRSRMDHIHGLLGVYYGMVRFIDDGVGRILDALEDAGLRENTIVVFCSDHGDFMGEHNMQCKGGVFYDCLTRVPLILSWPTHLPCGDRDGSMVNLIDVVPTLLNLQGLPVPPQMQGQGLPGATSAAPRDAAFSEYGAGGPPFCLDDLMQLPQPHGRRALIASLRWREAAGRRKMVRTHRWKYVHDPMGDLDELYDLERDPWELANLAGNADVDPVVCDLRRRLVDWSIMTEDGRLVPLPG